MHGDSLFKHFSGNLISHTNFIHVAQLYLKSIILAFLLQGATLGYGQFHSLTLPVPSPASSVSRQVGVTTIAVNFSSPAVKGRDIWNDPQVIPQGGKPIAWRAGANANTTISFDTDVQIEGKALPAGKYGFHIVPDGHQHRLLFAARNNLWGSYYLDQEKDPVLVVEVTDTAAPFSEHLDFEFLQQTDSSVVLALAWGDRRIPFKVSVDLIATTLGKLRYQLDDGDNTYRWEAWNDAAAWCLSRKTNLEEALTWCNRSIKGGYGGFGGNKNVSNMTTKARLLQAMGNLPAMHATLEETIAMVSTAEDARAVASLLLQLEADRRAVAFLKDARANFEGDWVLLLFSGVAAYYQDDLKKAKKHLQHCERLCPEFFQERLKVIRSDMETNQYAFPNRSGA